MISRLLSSAVIASVMLVASSALAKSSIEGRWRAVSMVERGKTFKFPASASMTLVFGKGGVWTTVAKHGGKSMKGTGTWSLRGNTLVTTERGRTETNTVTFKGSTLVMKGKRGTMVLRRL